MSFPIRRWPLAGLALIATIGADAPGPTETAPKGYVAFRATTPVVIDGDLSDPAWKDAPWTDDFVDIEGDVKPLPRFRTHAKMLWDGTYFYVAAELFEPHVWGTLKDHDTVIFQDNDFEVFIDPDGDNHEYYEFEMNALNTGWDLFLKSPYRDGGPALNEWEIPGLKTAVKVNGTLNDPTDVDASWTLEIAFPWKVLAEYAHRPAPPKVGDQWRVNFSRVEWEHVVEGKTYKKVPGRREDNWVWSPQGVVDMHRPERWGFVQFAGPATENTAFRPDPTFPIRERLMRAYHAQRAYREKNKAYAGSLDLLNLRAVPPIAGEGPMVLKANPPDKYTAEIKHEGKEGPGTYSVRQDSRIEVRPNE